VPPEDPEPIGISPGATAISLAPTLLSGSSDQPGARGPGVPLAPYLVLLRMGFSRPPDYSERRWALTPPFHPYPDKSGRYVSVALSVGSPLPCVTGHPAWWSSDFPLRYYRSSRPVSLAYSVYHQTQVEGNAEGSLFSPFPCRVYRPDTWYTGVQGHGIHHKIEAWNFKEVNALERGILDHWTKSGFLFTM